MIHKTKKLLLNPWFQLVLTVLFVTTSEVFLKRGAVEAPRLPEQVNWTGVSGLASPNVWYGILFVIVFAETGFVVTPFLPGDSLLFATGALCATGALNTPAALGLLALAAFTGNAEQECAI